MRSIIVLCSVLAVASGFTAPVSITNTVDAAPSIVSAPHQQLLNDGINAWSASSSSVVLSDESAEDMVARIAAKSAAANEAARAKADKEAAQKAGAKDGSSNLVLGVGAAGVALTLPFFLPNLLRLGSKLSSGGEDDGYGKR